MGNVIHAPLLLGEKVPEGGMRGHRTPKTFHHSFTVSPHPSLRDTFSPRRRTGELS